MTSPPNSSTSQCTGRTNSAADDPQRMRLGMGRASSDFCTMPGSRLTVARPGFSPSKYKNSPLPSTTRLSASTATPHFSANLMAAVVGWPALSKAAFTGGPLSFSDCAACIAPTPFTSTASRRGVA